MSQAKNRGEKPFILRGKVSSVLLYEVTEHELDTLEKGTPTSLFLNFGIALLSISCSFLVALLTTNIDSDRLFMVFTFIVIVGFIIGILLMCLWYRNRQSINVLVKKSRAGSQKRNRNHLSKIRIQNKVMNPT